MSDVDKTSPSAPQTTALPTDAKKQRDRRNLSIALGLGVFIILVFAVTILRIGGAGTQ